MYILTLLSRGPESGYSIIQKIDEKTEGAWRPGPGTIYPLLAGLVKEGQARPASHGSKGRKLYALTSKGKRELENLKSVIAGMGRKEGVMAKLFADILPGDVYVAMVVRRFREGATIFRQKVSEVPEPERSTILKEYKLLLESQGDWAESSLRASKAKP